MTAPGPAPASGMLTPAISVSATRTAAPRARAPAMTVPQGMVRLLMMAP